MFNVLSAFALPESCALVIGCDKISVPFAALPVLHFIEVGLHDQRKLNGIGGGRGLKDKTFAAINGDVVAINIYSTAKEGDAHALHLDRLSFKI